ncbi:MAG: nucleotide exchange factor GrpE [Elusimicrobia bacterium]|nr:nucleotide exchange factor GrpE [Elusimicrobiota bacterium]
MSSESSKEAGSKDKKNEEKEFKEAQKAQEYYDQLLRLRAEFDNFRKRVDREKSETVQWGKAQVLLKLLPLYDVLLKVHQQIQNQDDKSLSGDSSAPAETSGQDEFGRGMELIFKEFEKLLKSEYVFPMEVVGKPLDPLQHEVLGAVPREDVPEGTVVEEIQKGFWMNGQVLRPARVRIAKKDSSKC